MGLKYLGVIVTSDCSDNSNIAQQLSGMYCRSNMLIINFMACSTDIKIKVFKHFAVTNTVHSYGITQKKASKISTVYNKGLHRLLLYKIDSFQYGASEIFVANNVDSLNVLIRKSLHGFYTCLVTCDNGIIKCLLDYFLYHASPL